MNKFILRGDLPLSPVMGRAVKCPKGKLVFSYEKDAYPVIPRDPGTPLLCSRTLIYDCRSYQELFPDIWELPGKDIWYILSQLSIVERGLLKNKNLNKFKKMCLNREEWKLRNFFTDTEGTMMGLIALSCGFNERNIKVGDFPTWGNFLSKQEIQKVEEWLYNSAINDPALLGKPFKQYRKSVLQAVASHQQIPDTRDYRTFQNACNKVIGQFKSYSENLLARVQVMCYPRALGFPTEEELERDAKEVLANRARPPTEAEVTSVKEVLERREFETAFSCIEQEGITAFENRESAKVIITTKGSLGFPRMKWCPIKEEMVPCGKARHYRETLDFIQEKKFGPVYNYETGSHWIEDLTKLRPADAFFSRVTEVVVSATCGSNVTVGQLEELISANCEPGAPVFTFLERKILAIAELARKSRVVSLSKPEISQFLQPASKIGIECLKSDPRVTGGTRHAPHWEYYRSATWAEVKQRIGAVVYPNLDLCTDSKDSTDEPIKLIAMALLMRYFTVINLPTWYSHMVIFVLTANHPLFFEGSTGVDRSNSERGIHMGDPVCKVFLTLILILMDEFVISFIKEQHKATKACSGQNCKLCQFYATRRFKSWAKVCGDDWIRAAYMEGIIKMDFLVDIMKSLTLKCSVLDTFIGWTSGKFCEELVRLPRNPLEFWDFSRVAGRDYPGVIDYPRLRCNVSGYNINDERDEAPTEKASLRARERVFGRTQGYALQSNNSERKLMFALIGACTEITHDNFDGLYAPSQIGGCSMIPWNPLHLESFIWVRSPQRRKITNAIMVMAKMSDEISRRDPHEKFDPLTLRDAGLPVSLYTALCRKRLVPLLCGEDNINKFDEEEDDLSSHLEDTIKNFGSSFIIATRKQQMQANINMRAIVKEDFAFTTPSEIAAKLISLKNAFDIIDPKVSAQLPAVPDRGSEPLPEVPELFRTFDFDLIYQFYSDPNHLEPLRFETILDSRIMDSLKMISDYEVVNLFDSLKVPTPFMDGKPFNEVVTILSKSYNFDTDNVLLYRGVNEGLPLISGDRPLVAKLISRLSDSASPLATDATGALIVMEGLYKGRLDKTRAADALRRAERFPGQDFLLDDPNILGALANKIFGDRRSNVQRAIAEYLGGHCPPFTFDPNSGSNDSASATELSVQFLGHVRATDDNVRCSR